MITAAADGSSLADSALRELAARTARGVHVLAPLVATESTERTAVSVAGSLATDPAFGSRLADALAVIGAPATRLVPPRLDTRSAAPRSWPTNSPAWPRSGSRPAGSPRRHRRRPAPRRHPWSDRVQPRLSWRHPRSRSARPSTPRARPTSGPGGATGSRRSPHRPARPSARPIRRAGLDGRDYPSPNQLHIQVQVSPSHCQSPLHMTDRLLSQSSCRPRLSQPDQRRPGPPRGEWSLSTRPEPVEGRGETRDVRMRIRSDARFVQARAPGHVAIVDPPGR